MKVLALDLSKSRTGWAVWDGKSQKAIFGHWTLGTAYTSRGRTFAKLHAELNGLWRLTKFENIYFEQPINPASLSGSTNIETLQVLSGLAAHAESFAYAVGCRQVEGINVSSWRRDFIGPQKRGTKRHTLKTLTIERCQQLGFSPRFDDEADAIGILDYSLGLNGIVPPWRKDEVLRPMLTGAK